MKLSACTPLGPRTSQRGFSLVELLLSVAVLLIITTLAVPVILRSLQSYHLNSTASQLSGILKFAKFEAIRQNTPVSAQVQQQGTNWIVWVDSNGNGVADGAEPQMIVGGGFTLLSTASVPSTSSISSALGAENTMAWTVVSSNGGEWYDHRGVLCFQGGTTPCPPPPITIYAFFIGNPNDPSAGYRAIVTLPSGAVQVWTSSSAGPWQRVS